MIYCHHHSKGAGSKYSNAMDRASGSGVFARDPDAILDMTELNPGEAEYKYKNRYCDANESISAWEMTYTLRSFPPRYGSRLWFDHPIHRPDELNILRGAKYKDGSNRGKGNEQTAKEDNERAIEESFENLVFANGFVDCVSREDLVRQSGIADKNLHKFIGTDSRWESATLLDTTKVVVRRNAASVVYKGVQYFRPKNKNERWLTATME